MSNGFIDIHSHTLWGMDDGARDIETAVDMCHIAAHSGTRVLFLTPHLMYWENAESLFDERNEKADYLKDVLVDNNIDIDLKLGFEILCDDDIFNVKYFKPYTLCDSRYILIEFDFFKPTIEDVEAWLKYLVSFDLVPIIAHPERYAFIRDNSDCLKRFSDMGVLFQVNMQSFTGVFGAEIQDFAVEMLNNGLVSFVGSDAHDYRGRNTDIALCLKELPDDCDVEFLNKALYDNPIYIVKDEKIIKNS